jgi:hypothetical protein
MMTFAYPYILLVYGCRVITSKLTLGYGTVRSRLPMWGIFVNEKHNDDLCLPLYLVSLW